MNICNLRPFSAERGVCLVCVCVGVVRWCVCVLVLYACMCVCVCVGVVCLLASFQRSRTNKTAYFPQFLSYVPHQRPTLSAV